MNKTIRWLLVADAGGARVFEIDAACRQLRRQPVVELSSATEPSREIASDRPGRVYDSAGAGRHAKETPTDPNRYEKLRFAGQVAKMLHAERLADRFEELYLVAPPQMLGDLRQELSMQVRDTVIRETAKDLTKLPAHELETKLAELMAG